MRYPDGKKLRLYRETGKAIHDVRMKHGVSMAKLAKTIGVSVGQLDKIEEGHACPLHILVAVADEFDTTLDELVPVLVA